MNVIESVLEKHQQDQAACRARYCALIARGDDPQEGDAQELAALLDALGKSPDDARSDLATIQEVRRLESLANPADGEKLTREISEAAAEFNTYSEETRKLAREREQEELRLNGLVITARMKRNAWQENNGLLLRLRRQHWELLGLDPPAPRVPDPKPYQGPTRTATPAAMRQGTTRNTSPAGTHQRGV
jgi:hypothetical protein